MSLENILRKGLYIVSKEDEADRLQNLLETLEAGEVEIAKEWIRAAIKLLREGK